MSSTKQLKGFTTALDLPDLPFTKRGEGNLPQRSHMNEKDIREAMQDAIQALNDAKAQLVKLQLGAWDSSQSSLPVDKPRENFIRKNNSRHTRGGTRKIPAISEDVRLEWKGILVGLLEIRVDAKY